MINGLDHITLISQYRSWSFNWKIRIWAHWFAHKNNGSIHNSYTNNCFTHSHVPLQEQWVGHHIIIWYLLYPSLPPPSSCSSTLQSPDPWRWQEICFFCLLLHGVTDWYFMRKLLWKHSEHPCPRQPNMNLPSYSNFSKICKLFRHMRRRRKRKLAQLPLHIPAAFLF